MTDIARDDVKRSADTEGTADSASVMAPPRAEPRPTTRTFHGDSVIDEYAWFANREDPDVLQLIEQENTYADARLAPLQGLQEAIVGEIKARTQETDIGVPVQRGQWWYYSRISEGEQYATWARVRSDDMPELVPGQPVDGEEILVDGPALAQGHEFFRLGALEISADGTRLAYAVDTSGDEHYALAIKDLTTGEVIDESITDIGYGVAFSYDASQVYYVRVNESWRPYQVWRHQVGGDGDELIFQEDDERFWLGLDASRDNRWATISLDSSTTSEVHLLDLTDPQAQAVCVCERQPGVEYNVTVARDHLLIVHNGDHEDFQLCWAPLGPAPKDTWDVILTAGQGERLLVADPFDTHAVVVMRAAGVTALRVLPYEGGHYGTPWDLPTEGEVRTIDLLENPMPDTRRIRYSLCSLLTPTQVRELNLDTGEDVLLKETPVPNYDPSQFKEQRLWVTARDGAQIPVSLVAHKDIQPDGTNPGLLYGYGSYEVSIDPGFVTSRLSLLERGCVYAIAHIRGGGEMGRSWYTHGKLGEKMNTFTDFVDVGQALVEQGWVAPGRLAAEGASAGGLLMGAVTNLAPDLWRVVHAAVPFVDALTTILNPDLPLTAGEWEEWGNPIEDAEIYRLMRSYSPYENIAARQYPALLVTTSLNDVRVFFTEPLKWVQRLRATVTNDPQERPILLRCQMVAGHGGKSGRYDAWAERAEELAFILTQLGIEQ